MPDPLGQYVGIFARMLSVRTWDKADGDAQFMKGVADNSFDFVHSSHCLEHMVDVTAALHNWIRVLKPDGYLIVTVPDEDLYELGQWPSKFNADHKWTFTIAKASSWSPRSINVVDLVKKLANVVELERLISHRDFFRQRYTKKNPIKRKPWWPNARLKLSGENVANGQGPHQLDQREP